MLYGCNIDFILLRGKGNYVFNYKDGSVRCQQQELDRLGGERGCLAVRDAGELEAPERGSAETADLQYAESAANNKVSQTPDGTDEANGVRSKTAKNKKKHTSSFDLLTAEAKSNSCLQITYGIHII